MLPSLVPRPSRAPVNDHLQDAKSVQAGGKEGLGTRLHEAFNIGRNFEEPECDYECVWLSTAPYIADSPTISPACGWSGQLMPRPFPSLQELTVSENQPEEGGRTEGGGRREGGEREGGREGGGRREGGEREGGKGEGRRKGEGKEEEGKGEMRERFQSMLPIIVTIDMNTVYLILCYSNGCGCSSPSSPSSPLHHH